MGVANLSWLLVDRCQFWEELCTLWANWKLRNCMMHQCWKLGECGIEYYTEVVNKPGETSREERIGAMPEWLMGMPTTGWTTGEVGWKGVVVTQGEAMAADLAEGEGLGNNSFWLHLDRVGYTNW